MKLPQDALIAPAKLTGYLLVWREENDKSRWLASAGYSPDNWSELERDLRQQLLPLEARLVEETRYGELYEIRGRLVGPNDTVLPARSFWMIEAESGLTKFITIYPERQGR